LSVAAAYIPDDLCELEAGWTQAIADVEAACVSFCEAARLDPRLGYRDHFEHVSIAMGELLNAAVRLDATDRRMRVFPEYDQSSDAFAWEVASLHAHT
jgi:hypothetical protein